MNSAAMSNEGRAAKILDALQNDLKSLCMETKKRYPHIKDSCEEAIIKVRGAAMNPQSSLAQITSQILYPLVQAAETKDPKIVKLALAIMQRLIVADVVDESSGEHVVETLWMLMETGVEELKVLQTVTLLLTTSTVIQGPNLAKALVLCFRLHFTKDATVVNTASATVRQLVSVVFERVVAEDAKHYQEEEGNKNDSDESVSLEELKVLSSSPPKTLRPAAADAYLMFQDLVQLVNADQPLWLLGLTEMTRTFGLELLESVLTTFPAVFYHTGFDEGMRTFGLELLESILTTYPTIFHDHPEFNFLLRDRVCALVIKLFSPNIKYRASVPASVQQATPLDKPYFPIAMRLLRVVSVLIQKYYPLLVTQCEIFLSFMVKFLDGDRPVWQRGLALEVLHKIATQPELLKSFCTNYDMKPHATKIFQDIVNSLGSFVKSLFMSPQSSITSQLAGGGQGGGQGQSPAMLAGMPVGPGVSPQPAFFYRGVYLPLCVNIPTGQAKSSYLEMLDKLEPPNIPDGYGVSVAYYCLLDIIRSIHLVMMGPQATNDGQTGLMDQYKPTEGDRKIHEQLVNSAWCGLLSALTVLLEACTDEAATENILKAMQTFASLAGKLELTTPRDTFITALCKSCLPPHYTLTVLNNASVAAASSSMSRGHQRSPSAESQHPYYDAEYSLQVRHQVVAVGTALATPSLPVGAQQGPVMLTNKNLQCMRATLSMAHCHGGVLGAAWHLLLTTLQHLVWILGLKPSTGGSLKAGRSTTETNAVITTAVIADLPVLSSMLSRLFESSQHLDDVALHHLIDALCQLSRESMELAYTNREPSLFAVAKLLETGVVNLGRVEVLWRPVTNHLLDVCQHPHVRMREWGVEAVTYLVKAALTHKHNPPLKDNQKLQTLLLSPLSEISLVGHPDVRQKQLESLLHILHSCGELLHHGWPLILNIIGAINDNHSEHLVRLAFQCLQLVVTDFLPLMPWACLPLTVDTAAKFGSQTQELNISLTAIGLMWNISDYFYQNQEKLRASLTSDNQVFPDFPGVPNMPPFDKLWMCLYARLGDLCVDSRPAVRKSAGQTLFSTIAAHGALLHNQTWQAVLWQVLFPLLDKVRQLSDSASTDKVDQGGNILIHHSRNTQQKQWAETQVLTLSGVARVFSTKQKILQGLGDFPRAWALLLDFIHTAALSKSNEVSLAALKSLQEMLQAGRSSTVVSSGSSDDLSSSSSLQSPLPEDSIANWNTAWKVWHTIGTEVTKPPPEEVTRGSDAYIPSQPFLTALVHIFPHLFQHIKPRFVVSDFTRLAAVLSGCVSVPVHGESSPFIHPSFTDVVVTPLQEGVLQALTVIEKEITEGSVSSRAMVPELFTLLLQFSHYSCQAPSYGNVLTRPHTTKGSADWVTMNFVPFAERSMSMLVTLYQTTCAWKEVIEAQVLKNIIQGITMPLHKKYRCPAQTTWKLAITTLLAVLQEGLQLAREHPTHFREMWPVLATALESFLFSESPPPANQSSEDAERDESIDCQVVELIREEILPYASTTPSDFIVSIMVLLNKGSIESASGGDSECEGFKLREEFAKTCFETLLQFSLLAPTDFDVKLDGSAQGSTGNMDKLGAAPHATTKLAVTSLLHRFREVLVKYVEDEKLSGKAPLPRHRIAEISFVLKAIATLLKSLKTAPVEKVDSMTWAQLIGLYPHLVEVGGASNNGTPQLWRSLREVLLQYAQLLRAPVATSEADSNDNQVVSMVNGT
ncbi:protein MON2 homolog isoform X3 [Penaeus chinensis]|uniref:protein MON2 homolog isoform X3 n=1 Tax=Penaeus chinensis TaxID=139456 RepID=UPI001FB5E360|nr:protein MON2 homolog isoform X3 [Penaeus chinensis]